MTPDLSHELRLLYHSVVTRYEHGGSLLERARPQQVLQFPPVWPAGNTELHCCSGWSIVSSCWPCNILASCPGRNLALTLAE